MFRPIKNRRTFELVEQEIREAILSGSMKPGDKLPSERKLAREMEVGRSVIREALRNLEFSGLVHIKHGGNGGIFAKTPDSSVFTKSFSYLIRLGEITIDHLTEARLMIEKDIIELAMKKNKNREDFKAVDEIISSAFDKYDRGLSPRQENFEFHTVLAELSQNPILIMIDNAILPILYSFVKNLQPTPDQSKRVLEYHRDILGEMKKGNVSSAKALAEEHIIWFFDEFRDLRELRSIRFEDLLLPNS